MNVHKELYKLFYQAERVGRAGHFKHYYKCPLSLSQDAIRMAYRYSLDGIDIVYLFNAQAAATSVMVNRRKPNFQQSQKLQDGFDRRTCGSEQ